jgi:hypothetical protein
MAARSMATGLATHPDPLELPFMPAAPRIALMIQRNGRWRGEADESNGPRGLRDDRLRAGDSHDVQGTHIAHPQDEYTVAAAFRLPRAENDAQHWRRYRERLRY